MIIVYLRSSSFNNWDFCQQQYFIQYVLGYQQPANVKAEKGTVVHKVMEVLANMKLATQNNPDVTHIRDEHIGDFFFTKEALTEPTELSDIEIEEINGSRLNKQTYMMPCKLSTGHVRYGAGIVNDVFQRAYAYYSHADRSNNTWRPQDKKDCENFIWMALDYRNGLYDIRKKEIFATEHQFQLEIKEPWAKYDIIGSRGERISGNLEIKGTVDLVLRVDEDTLEVLDWKTGQRFDWAKKKEKTYAELQKDPQLRLYYYAIRKLYPDIKNVILTIFFVRNGGPFSLHFEDKDIEETEHMIQRRFREIRNCEEPLLIDPSHKDFKCNKLCPFSKMKLKPEHKLNCCHQVAQDIKLYGIDYVVAEHQKPGFSVGKYNAPGEA